MANANDAAFPAIAQSDAHPSIEPVTFWYQNYRGEISRRVAAVLGLRWGTSEYHKEPQWLLRAFDLEKEVEREFAVKDMAPTYDALRQSDAEPGPLTIVVALSEPAVPPRPDASGLVEAAELAEREAKSWSLEGRFVLEDFAKTLRARAADRGGK